MEEVNKYICKKCKKPKDYPGYYCHECSEYLKNYRRESRKFFKKMGLCSECGKYTVYGSDITCFECRAKQQTYRDAHRKPLTDNEKSKMRIHNRNIYKERIENNLCTRCGLRKPAEGKKKCAICLEKDAKKHRERWKKTHPFVNAPADKHCRWCKSTNLVEGKKCCPDCYKKMVDNLNKVRTDYWRKENRAIFKRKDETTK